MRIPILFLLVLVFFPAPAGAQEPERRYCWGCVIGVWDDEAMTVNTGTIEPRVPKDIYVGIRFDDDEFNALQALEFSIAGMRFEEDGITLLSVTELVFVSIQLGFFQAPADTSATSTGRGGIVAGYSQPVVGDHALFKLQLYTLEPIVDKVLQVKRRYPPTNPIWNTPAFAIPNLYFTVIRATGGCYILNWSGDPGVSCDVITGIEATTWSAVKRLYR